MRPFLLSTVFFLVSLSAYTAMAQFGVTSKRNVLHTEINDDFDGVHPREALVQTLLSRGRGQLSVEDATNIAFLLESANNDRQTQDLVYKMRNDEKESIAALVAETSDEQLILHLRTALEEIKMLDTLFADPARVVKEMEKEGMIDPKRLKDYKNNPALLESDTRKSLYFSFLTLSVAAGFL